MEAGRGCGRGGLVWGRGIFLGVLGCIFCGDGSDWRGLLTCVFRSRQVGGAGGGKLLLIAEGEETVRSREVLLMQYEVQLEVEGPVAMFARPDTGATPVSYPVPTWSAAKGMFDAVVWRPHAYIHPTFVEICRPVRYERYVTNYGGPLRKADQIKRNNNYQLHATVLVDVCYRIHGRVHVKRSTRGKQRPQLRRRSGKDWGDELSGLFTERLANGQTFYTPCLGWKEFVPTYFGPTRKNESGEPLNNPEPSINLALPSLLHTMWEHRQLKPEFKQDWHIVEGVMSYEERVPEVSDVE